MGQLAKLCSGCQPVHPSAARTAFASDDLALIFSQVPPDEATNAVRISGRVMFPGGDPVSTQVRMAQIEPEGLKDERSVPTDSHGVFKNYRIYLVLPCYK